LNELRIGTAFFRVLAVTIIAFMDGFFEPLDRLSGITDETGLARWLDRAAFIFLVLMAVTAPHSIAASEISWLIGLTATVIRLAVKPRGGRRIRPLDIALWGFFGWSVISAAFSYEPATSFDRLRGIALFLVYVFVAVNVRQLRAAWFLALVLISSSMINVVREPIARIIGRGVEVHGLNPDGPLARAGLVEGDTLLRVNGQKLSDPAEIISALETGDVCTVDMHRPDMYESKVVRRADLLNGDSPAEKLGFKDWHPSHYWRATGFYRHWITYSEVLQLLISLVFGLLFASFIYRRKETNPGEPAVQAGSDGDFASPVVRVVTSKTFLAVCVVGMGVAMLLTGTRASQLSFVISAFVIVAVSSSRKFLLAAALVAVPVALVGFIVLQQSRQVGLVDPNDDSARYRMTMWRDGVRLWTASPRNFIFGIGMDSKDKHWREWQMYDGGRIPLLHFHSAPIQLVTERGLLSILIWISILGLYGRTLCEASRPTAAATGGPVAFFWAALAARSALSAAGLSTATSSTRWS
jgi:hypothetical protein